MITTVLIIHALMAVALLGALSHQTLRMWWPAAKRTGAFLTEYLLPQQAKIRRVFVDNSTTPVTVWIGNNHYASIVRLEPLY
jgi:hypothetical protein